MSEHGPGTGLGYPNPVFQGRSNFLVLLDLESPESREVSTVVGTSGWLLQQGGSKRLFCRRLFYRPESPSDGVFLSFLVREASVLLS